MSNYRRSKGEGGTFFFTVVTYDRQPILTNPQSIKIMREAWKNTNKRFPFETVAVCFLPEHIHTIWTLPEGDADYSKRWGEIKRLFSKEYLELEGIEGPRNESRKKRGEATIWQRRFWEHTIKDEQDLKCHVEYIHYNPVKHGHVLKTADWQWSSFRKFVANGLYPLDWGVTTNFSNPKYIFGE
jgi:putative transposase